MAKELFLEIGLEEMPAAFLPKAIDDLKENFRGLLKEKRVSHGEITALATPRRLCLCCENLAEKQEDQIIEKIGPATQTAYDKGGNPGKALLGFAKGQGVRIEDLKIVKTEKGEYYCAHKKVTGEMTVDLLPRLLTGFITSLQFKRSMRWGSFSLRFARPIHWLVSLYGGEVVPFFLENIVSGRTTYGHRFMAPAPIAVDGFADYSSKLRKSFVVVSPEERKRAIVEAAQKAAKEINGTPLIDDDLLTEVTFLVEYPGAVCGSFFADYLKLPKEVLTTTMMSHQRYFPVVDDNGEILPYFIAITNTSAMDPAGVRRGNEKVIRARLKDAEFFFHEDQKVSLSERVEGLKKVVYHSQMGTSFEKVERFSALVDYVSSVVAPEKRATAARAALLAKADLDTQMVGEFPELQGIMGREYALMSGEAADVAAAIYEHYLPTVAGGVLPTTDEGAIVSIADKTDTITGFFGVGLAPTGTADPYAMRRQAVGIINIIINQGYRLSLSGLLDKSIAVLGNKMQREAATVKNETLEFFRARLENLLIMQGYPGDVVDAVCSVGVDDILQTFRKVKAMSAFRDNKNYEPLAVVFKRARNIIKGFSGGKVEGTLFVHDAERELFERYLTIKEKAGALMEEDEIESALEEMAALRSPIDKFFDSIMVMDKDEKIRFNRQSLLKEIFVFFSHIADFSRIATEQKQG